MTDFCKVSNPLRVADDKSRSCALFDLNLVLPLKTPSPGTSLKSGHSSEYSTTQRLSIIAAQFFCGSIHRARRIHRRGERERKDNLVDSLLSSLLYIKSSKIPRASQTYDPCRCFTGSSNTKKREEEKGMKVFNDKLFWSSSSSLFLFDTSLSVLSRIDLLRLLFF